MFFFDLDATITKAEILQEIAEKTDKKEQIDALMKNVSEDVPFYHTFIEKIMVLKSVPISTVRNIVNNISLSDKIVEFIRENKDRCYIVTSVPDVWVDALMSELGMQERYFSTKAISQGDYVVGIEQIIDKGQAVRQIVEETGCLSVVTGDGNNDAQMMVVADVSIGYGGVRAVSPTVLKCATHVVYSEDRLCQFLRQLL